MNEGPSKEPSESEKTPVESDGTEKREDQKTNSGSDPITPTQKAWLIAALANLDNPGRTVE